MSKANVPANGIVVGDTVSFLPGPRSKRRITGTVIEIVPPAHSGRGSTTRLKVECADKTRMVIPGAATKVG